MEAIKRFMKIWKHFLVVTYFVYGITLVMAESTTCLADNEEYCKETGESPYKRWAMLEREFVWKRSLENTRKIIKEFRRYMRA